MNIEQYKSNLRMKIMVLQRVNENLLQQHKAINSTDTALLSKLLKRQQKNIDRLNHINRLFSEEPCIYTDSDCQEYEAAIETMLKDAIREMKFGITAAEELRNAFGTALYQQKINGKVLKNGYLGSGMQQYGHFIDKRK